ncbi:glycosyltransferase [Chondrinema litorale]|uniref:glycosyltransferase n=1 Tax=Chondrinema litorale TaxID=2994555 RepID=UPI0025427D2A|nr:glycosyltransferase [Chondrinema litorale]UZR98016.1 glycosyltransferase [Chondrinema litorale]
MGNNLSEIPIVFQAMPRWDHPYESTAINIAKRLSKKRTVFYVEHPYTWKDLLTVDQSKIYNRLDCWNPFKQSYHKPYDNYQNLIYIVPSPQIPFNFLPEGNLFEAIRNNINNKIWKTIDKVIDKFNYNKFIYINSFDPVFAQVRSQKELVANIYQSVDNISGEKYIAKHGIRAEKEATINADLVLTTSKELKNKLGFYNNQTHAIENGVDYYHFAENVDGIPEDLSKIEGIKILYVGNIGLRIDYNLIEQIAKKFPQWNWVFVGPEDKREFKGQRLKSLNNVYFLGKKSYSELPPYIRFADACILPFKCNELTKCIYPLKINEYFACGKPVLSTSFSDFYPLSNEINFFNSIDSFESQMEDIINSNNNSDRKKGFALNNDWNSRTKQIEMLISNVLVEKSSQKDRIQKSIPA